MTAVPSDRSGTALGVHPGARVGLGLYVAVLLLINLPAGSIANSTDAVYGTVILDVAENGHWLTPGVAGAPYLMKPPLYFWSAALSVMGLGDGPLGFRFVTALSAWITVMLCAGMAARISRGTAAFLLGGALALASPTFFEYSRRVFMEVPLALFLMAVLYVAVRAVQDNDVRWLVLLGPLTAAAVLTKSYAGGFAATAVVLYLLAAGPRRWLWSKELLLGIAAGGVVLVVWLGTMLSVAPDLFIEQMTAPFRLGSEAQFSWYRTGRFFYLTAPMKVDALVTVTGVLGLLGGGLVALRRPQLRPLWMLALYVVITVLIFSQLTQQRLYYMVPVFPVLGVAAAAAITAWVRDGHLRGALAAGMLLVLPAMDSAAYGPEIVDPNPLDRALGVLARPYLPPGVTVYRYNDFFAITELSMRRRAVQWTPSDVLLHDLSRILVLGDRGIAQDGKPPAVYARYRELRAAQEPFFAVFDEGDLQRFLPGLPGVYAWAAVGPPGFRQFLISDQAPPSALAPLALPDPDPAGVAVAVDWMLKQGLLDEARGLGWVAPLPEQFPRDEPPTGQP